ncbi:MAG: Fic family protein [Deltaproteobacteria bacterium]|nr:Fic family protein [Deltaproteobacteria bacterium]
MKTPTKPPFTVLQLLSAFAEGNADVLGLTDDFFRKALTSGIGVTHDGRYLHWDELVRRTPPSGISREMIWAAMKLQRQIMSKPIPLEDGRKRRFTHLDALPEPAPEILRFVDMEAGGAISSDALLPDGDKTDRYIIKSLIEESITSSQIEGASTTRKVAAEMIRSGRRPRNRSERMIFNNYSTMQHVRTLRGEKLTPDIVFDLHRRITAGTMDEPSESGRFRRADEPVHVVEDHSGQVLYVPPPATELESRLAEMCDFANGKTPGYYLHPVVRSIILHFWLAYDHPFVDGNGRCARSLFYWSMLRHGYWMFEYVSISRLIREAQTQYARAFLHTETDDNDLTYFILYHLQLIKRAIDDVHVYLRKKARDLELLSSRLGDMRELNHRQRALIVHALKKERSEYTVRSHMTLQNVTHQTARMDLYDLVRRGLLSMKKVGKTFYFHPVRDLENRLKGS